MMIVGDNYLVCVEDIMLREPCSDWPRERVVALFDYITPWPDDGHANAITLLEWVVEYESFGDAMWLAEQLCEMFDLAIGDRTVPLNSWYWSVMLDECMFIREVAEALGREPGKPFRMRSYPAEWFEPGLER